MAAEHAAARPVSDAEIEDFLVEGCDVTLQSVAVGAAAAEGDEEVVRTPRDGMAGLLEQGSRLLGLLPDQDTAGLAHVLQQRPSSPIGHALRAHLVVVPVSDEVTADKKKERRKEKVRIFDSHRTFIEQPTLGSGRQFVSQRMYSPERQVMAAGDMAAVAHDGTEMPLEAPQVEILAANDFNQDLDKAAVKIQAMTRGKQERKRRAEAGEEQQDTTAPTQTHTPYTLDAASASQRTHPSTPSRAVANVVTVNTVTDFDDMPVAENAMAMLTASGNVRVFASHRKFNEQPAFASRPQFVSQRMYSPERQVLAAGEIAAAAHDSTEVPLNAQHDQILAANDLDQNLDKAAVKIQAMARGKQERKRQAGAGKEQADAAAHTPAYTTCTLDAASPSQGTHPSTPAAPTQAVANASAMNTVTDSDDVPATENAMSTPSAIGNCRVFETHRKFIEQPVFGSDRQFVSQRIYSPERQVLVAAEVASENDGTVQASHAAEAGSSADMPLQSMTVATAGGDEQVVVHPPRDSITELLDEDSRLLEVLPDQDTEGLANVLQVRSSSLIGHALYAHLEDNAIDVLAAENAVVVPTPSGVRVFETHRTFSTQPIFGSGPQFVSQRMYAPERQVLAAGEMVADAHDGTEMPLEAPHDQLLAAYDFNHDLDKAAVKIQAMTRGKQERKRQAEAGEKQLDVPALDVPAPTPTHTHSVLDAASPLQDTLPSAPSAPSCAIANAGSVNTVADSDSMLVAENAVATPAAIVNARVFEIHRKFNEQPVFGSGRQFVSQRMYSPERKVVAVGEMSATAPDGTEETAPAAEAGSGAQVALQRVTAAAAGGVEEGMSELLQEGMAELLREGSRLLEVVPDQDREGLANLLQLHPTSPIGHALHARLVESTDDVSAATNADAMPMVSGDVNVFESHRKFNEQPAFGSGPQFVSQRMYSPKRQVLAAGKMAVVAHDGTEMPLEAPHDQLLAANDFNQDLDKAAVKIQAMARGKQERKRQAGAGEKKADAPVHTPAPTPCALDAASPSQGMHPSPSAPSRAVVHAGSLNTVIDLDSMFADENAVAMPTESGNSRVFANHRKFNEQPVFGSGRQFVSQRMYSPDRQVMAVGEIAAVAHDGIAIQLEAPQVVLLAVNDFNQDLDKAAVKIQAMARGKQERKRQAGAGKEQHDASGPTPPDTPCTLDAASSSQDTHPSAPAPSPAGANAGAMELEMAQLRKEMMDGMARFESAYLLSHKRYAVLENKINTLQHLEDKRVEEVRLQAHSLTLASRAPQHDDELATSHSPTEENVVVNESCVLLEASAIGEEKTDGVAELSELLVQSGELIFSLGPPVSDVSLRVFGSFQNTFVSSQNVLGSFQNI